MHLVDNALKAREAEGRPVRVGMVGAGFIAPASQTRSRTAFPACACAAIFNRRPDRAVQAFEYAGSGHAEVVSSQSELDDALCRELPAVAEDPS